MKINSVVRGLFYILFISLLWSCDDDFNSVGSNIVGDENLLLDSYVTGNIAAYSKATGAVQSDKLPLNSLGVINNPVFGKTIASYTTQLRISSGSAANTSINPEISKVELSIPYFSTLKSTDNDGNRTFELDSLYTAENAKFKLSIYESGYYLRDFDPDTNFEEYQKYYSDMYDQINNAKIGERLNNSEDASQNDEFFFDKSEHVIYETNSSGEQIVKERLNPQMLLELDKEFFLEKIFNAPAGSLESDNIFKNYFKGLFFQVEDTSNQSHLMQLNFAQAKITIYYTADVSADNTTRREGTVVMNFVGNSISLQQNYFSGNYTSALAASNDVTGDEKLYIKGGDGSMAYLNLFNGLDADNNGLSDELEELRRLTEEEKWMINEANLVFYVDKSQMDSNPFVPLRLYMFNAVDGVPLSDYSNDATTISSRPKFNKFIHGGILEKDENGKGYRYKFRITRHIQNLLIAEDPKNITLGLAVTENINMIAMLDLLSGIGQPADSPYKYVPATSVMNPFGTVLYGNNVADESKKLKLEILYTKP
jgi:hypothetical protein